MQSLLIGNIGTGRQRSARSSNKRNRLGKKNTMEHDMYMKLNNVASGGGTSVNMRPLSAPKINGGNKRAVSANNRRKPRIQSGRVKQIKQYLSEQEAANMQMQ